MQTKSFTPFENNKKNLIAFKFTDKFSQHENLLKIFHSTYSTLIYQISMFFYKGLGQSQKQHSPTQFSPYDSIIKLHL
jgi:hypothetical protein